ncbi:hypothetical protein ES703_96028 [subsurface metagenome]
MRTIRELLLVRGVTGRLLYGEDTNQNGQLDSNERDGDRSPPDDNEDGRLDKGLIEYLTCYSYDKNVDTLKSSSNLRDFSSLVSVFFITNSFYLRDLLQRIAGR